MDAIGRLFQLGNTIGRAIGDIGEYGSGGTKAIMWLSSSVSIWTLRDGKMQQDSALWKEWMAAESFDEIGVSDDWHPATLSNTPDELFELKHGTLIRLHLLSTRKVTANNLTRDLAKLFSTGLRKGKHIIWTTSRDEPKELADPFSRPSQKAEWVNFDIMIEYNNQHLPVVGRVFYDESTSQSESKIHIGYGYRIIQSVNDCFRSRDGEERFVGTGVSGWLDLGEGWQPYLSTTKDAIDDANLFDELMAYVFEEIKPLLKKAEHKTFDLLFEDLALGLEQALNTRAGDLSVEIGGEGGGRKRDPETIIEPNPDPRSGPEDWPLPPGNEPGDKQKNVPPSFRLAIYPTNDVQMEGMLCRAEIKGDEVMMLVNRDHAVVKTAMQSKPINRMALNLLVVTELSESIVVLQEGEKFVKKLFHPRLATLINDLEDKRNRSRTIARQLVDRVRTPIPVMEAAE